MPIKDKITPELKDRFIAAIQKSMNTGKENRFIICRDKEENLYTPRSTECPSYLQLEGEFHTHPYATVEKKIFERETNTQVPLENIRKLIIEENKKLKRDISGPSYNDVLTTLSLKCQGKNGTVCIINDLEPDRLECWTAKKEIQKELCDKANKELPQRPKGSPQPWIEHIFDKEIIKIKTGMEIEKEKRKLEREKIKLKTEMQIEEEKRRLEEEKRRLEEEKRRLEEEKRRLEEEKRRLEEEKRKIRLEIKIRLEEEKVKLEKEKKEEEKRRLEEKKRKLEEKITLEEKKITLEEKRRLEKKKITLGEIITEREERREQLLKSRSKKGLCRSLQDIVSQVKDPDSIFTDIDLVRKYTGCPIPTRKKKK